MSTATPLAGQELDTNASGYPADAELANRCAEGEERALATLYDRHVGHIRRYAQLIVEDEASAEDLVHDAFLRAIERLPTYRADTSLSVWLRRIVLNLARNHNRKVRRRRWLLAWRRRHPVDASRIQPAEGRVRLALPEREAFALC